MADVPSGKQNGNGNGNGNGGSWWRKWQTVIGTGTFLLIVGGLVFSWGRTDAAVEQRVTRLEVDMQLVRSEYARREVFEPRLTMIEREQEKIEKHEEDQARKLDDILMEMRRKGSR